MLENLNFYYFFICLLTGLRNARNNLNKLQEDKNMEENINLTERERELLIIILREIIKEYGNNTPLIKIEYMDIIEKLAI